MEQTFGRIRVSSRGQNEDRQLLALAATISRPKPVCIESKAAGALTGPLTKSGCARGICPAVKSIDKLGRNYEEIIAQQKQITRAAGADICIPDIPRWTHGGT